MENISQIVPIIEKIFGEKADEIGRNTGFIKREKKIRGRTFAKALVFGFQSNPEMTYEELSQSAAMIGLSMTAQGMEQRFNEKSAEFMRKLLEFAVGLAIIPQQIESNTLMKKFTGVYLRDSTVIQLPRELQNIWKGVGASQGANSAIKLQISLDYKNGQLYGPTLQNGREQDQNSPYQSIQLPEGSLQLGDLGYFSLKRFNNDQESGVFWISRLKTGTRIYTNDEQPIDLVPWLQAETTSIIDMPILMGVSHKISCRIIAVRAPQEVVDQRIYKMKIEAAKDRQPLSSTRIALAGWTIFVTNIPSEQLSTQEVCALSRIRWQIEMLFKLWKSYMKIDEWRSKNSWRILCEVYAKLLALLISHWVLITSIWKIPNRSLFKAMKTIQKFAANIAISLDNPADLSNILICLQHTLDKGCRLNNRRSRPNSFQIISTLC